MTRKREAGSADATTLDRAVATRKRRSYLDAVDTQRRLLRLKLTSGDLLRKPSNAYQARRMRRLAKDLGDQAKSQLRAQGRRAFRGDVAVEIDLHALAVDQPAASPPAVKAYLDLLQGVAYADDRAIAYLRITRHASDNPLFRAVTEDWIHGTRPRFPHGPEGHAEVRIAIQPLRTYVADFDRVFELRDEVFGDDSDEPIFGGADFFATSFDHGADDERLDQLREDERDDGNGRGMWAPGVMKPETLASLRRMRHAELRALQRRLLLDGGPGPLDRPGPAPVMHRWLWQEDPNSKRLDADDLFGPGRFLLPQPHVAPAATTWKDDLSQEMSALHGRWRILDVLVGAPLALDIAVRSNAHPNARDLDNLARDVVVPFEEIFCANERGTVASYRVYRAEQDTGAPGVRLLDG